MKRNIVIMENENREETLTGCEVFIGNLSYEITENELRVVCEEAGPVERVDLKKKKGLAFVTFADIESARKGLEILKGKKLYGRTIRVSEKVDTSSASKSTRKRYDEEGATLCKKRIEKEKEAKVRAEKKKRDRDTWEIKYGRRKKSPTGQGRSGRPFCSGDSGAEEDRDENRKEGFSQRQSFNDRKRGNQKKTTSASDRRRAREWAESRGFQDDERDSRDGFRGKRSGSKHGGNFSGEYSKSFNKRKERNPFGKDSDSERGDRGSSNKRNSERNDRGKRKERENSGSEERDRRPSRRVSGQNNRFSGSPRGRKRD